MGSVLVMVDECVRRLILLAQLTVMGMKHSEEKIALQAIEFWSTVCELETELAWEASEVCS